MEDKVQEVYSQYDLKIYNTYRARGAVVLETEDGLKLCRSFSGSEKRLEFEDCVKRHLIRFDVRNVDGFVRNREGALISRNSGGEGYVLRDWFEGEECNLKRSQRAFGAAANLAWLHIHLQGVSVPEGQNPGSRMRSQQEIFEKRSRELKRVKSYLRDKKQKNLFETQYLKLWDFFYGQACQASEMLAASGCENLWQEAYEEGLVCHGNYNYHNILVIKPGDSKRTGCLAAAELEGMEEYATTNFDRAAYGPQITDLYQFLRKAMEKNDWDTEYGMRLIEEYNKLRPIRAVELRLLYLLLLYPEKFWKITNYYYNNKKSWIPQKNIQKLMVLKDQIIFKERFLKELYAVI